MVRLLVPEGESQHAITGRPPGAIATQRDLIASPWRSSIAAAAVTGGFALVGRSRPGVFLKSAALIGAVDLTFTASGIYGRHELHRGVFKMEGIQPKPGKLWERTKHWTWEDATLGGGVVGAFLALNPRALPGVYGFARFFGAATVGCALGYKAGQFYIVRLPPQLLQLFDYTIMANRQKEYEKLQENEKAKSSLSRIGKLALWFHTSQTMTILRSPLQLGGIGGMGGISGGPGGHQSPHGSPLHALKAEMDKETVFQTEFKEGELAGPDVENGYRAYKDNLQSRDASKIQDWLEQVRELKNKIGSEWQYVWGYLGQKEDEFYQHAEEDGEKDLLRREIQLLNNMAADIVTRCAILEYHERDALKQLRQIEQTGSSVESDATSQSITAPYEFPHDSAEVAQSNHRGPRIATERIRTTWSRQKELLRHFDHAAARASEISEADSGFHVAEHLKRLKEDADQMRKNVEATGRLLRRFEDRVREADEEAKEKPRQSGVGSDGEQKPT
ncbi:hypothetical protein J4E86_004943 [Alternaria arbusti]|uniref:uncharacterized protein n=1 Tax=Alternaria arbusti TaxID=232088 RepID=UPI00221EB672|nr:uncharacterized protein J4E86_004943 [Alternaria arbusti]KAI4957804.1 hypothetical protein J4E86_004943 [Alternaria arbusti]